MLFGCFFVHRINGNNGFGRNAGNDVILGCYKKTNPTTRSVEILGAGEGNRTLA